MRQWLIYVFFVEMEKLLSNCFALLETVIYTGKTIPSIVECLHFDKLLG